MKSKVVDLEVGDLVVVSTRNTMLLRKVTKRTPTQIHINDTKYRIDGSEITTEKWYATSIYAPLQTTTLSTKTWLDIYQEQERKIKEEREYLITKIQAIDLYKVSIGKLKIILKELS